LVVAQRVSIRTLRPSVQPSSASPCANAVSSRITLDHAHERADAPHPVGLVRPRRATFGRVLEHPILRKAAASAGNGGLCRETPVLLTLDD
jgi:hypothetical protein